MTLSFPALLLELEFGPLIPLPLHLQLVLLIPNMTPLLTSPISLVVMPELTQEEPSHAHGTQLLMTQTSSRLTSRLDAQVPLGSLLKSERIFSLLPYILLPLPSKLTETPENAKLRPIPNILDQETISLPWCKLPKKNIEV